MCVGAVAFAVLALVVLFADILGKGWSAFLAAELELEVRFDAEVLAPGGAADPGALAYADYSALWKQALLARFPEAADDRAARRELFALVSDGASYRLQAMVEDAPSLLGETRRVELQADDEVGMLLKGQIERAAPEALRRISDRQLAWIDRLVSDGVLGLGFNETFFTSGDSREPELAGILGAAVGSFYAVLITLALCFPLGVATAVYLEEFAPRNRSTDLIEVNINNLAAVPSIVFGLLGLAVFIGFFGLPRSAPLVGGLVLSLMTLPIVIIAARVAIKTVPPTIREAAYGLGAARWQVVKGQVLPMALPGILTGTILALSRAVGETAPLIMVGAVGFIAFTPQGLMDQFTVLPLQIYSWISRPQDEFRELAAAGIIVLLALLLTMNAIAIVLRNRAQRHS
jgi:phosphate transport system permease protein